MALVDCTVQVAPSQVAVSTPDITCVKVSPVTTTIVVDGAAGIRGPKGETGEPGLQGPPGDTGIGSVTVTNPTENDLLRYNSGAWRNIPQTLVADGGNF